MVNQPLLTIIDNMPDEVRQAGLALVLVESSMALPAGAPRNLITHRLNRLTEAASHWAASRAMECVSISDLHSVVEDATRYLDEHPSEVDEWKRLVGSRGGVA